MINGFYVYNFVKKPIQLIFLKFYLPKKTNIFKVPQ